MTNFSTVFGIYKTRNETQETMDSLADEGFDTSQISLLFPENASPQSNLITTSSNLLKGQTINQNLDLMKDARTVHIPGYGPLIAAGPALDFLHNINHSDTGWLSEPIMKLGVPEFEAVRYENNVAEGGFLLAVDCPTLEKQQIAEKILSHKGARYIAFTTHLNITEEILGSWIKPHSASNKSATDSKFFQT